jgi:hypothetical protein
MLSGLRLGPGPRIRRLQLEAFPDLSVIQKHLFELSFAPAGARFDLSWPVGPDWYVLTLSHSQAASIADWKLYRHSKRQSRLIWEHRTNDVTLVYNLVMSETGQNNRIVSGDGKLSTIHGTLVNPEASAGNYVSGPNNTAEHPASMSSTIVDQVDLSQAKQLVRTLSVKDLEILSYPAFLLLFDQEYLRAIENGSHFTMILFKVESHCTTTQTVPPEHHALYECLKQLKALHRRTDILAKYKSDRFAVLLPETDTKGAKLFAQKIERALLRNAQMGESSGLFKIKFGIAGLHNRKVAARSILQAAELALSMSETAEESVVVLDTIADRCHETSTIELDRSIQHLTHSSDLDGRIYSHPAFLMFLEREYYRAIRNNEILFVLQLKLVANQTVYAEQAEPINSVRRTFIEKLIAAKRDGDILGFNRNGTFTILRPGASIGCLKNLASSLARCLDPDGSLAHHHPQLLGRVLTVTSNNASANLMNLIATA